MCWPGISLSFLSDTTLCSNEFVDAIFQSIIAQAEDKKQSILALLEEREEGVELLAPATAEWVGEWRPEEWPGPLLQWIA